MQQTEARTNRHAELAEFLLSRRARLLPESFGINRLRRRRRTPGLRREEISALAGISTAYYTWIEQGRTFDVSIDVLDAIASALRLSEVEAAHLFTLAGKVVQRSSLAVDGDANAGWREAILESCRQTGEAPALVLTPWCEVSAANLAAQEVLAVGKGRNFAEAFFCGGTTISYRRAEALARTLVAILRRNRAQDLENRHFNEIVGSLRNRSCDFKALWESHHVDNDALFEIEVERAGGSSVCFRGVIASDPTASRQFALLMSRSPDSVGRTGSARRP